MPYVALYVLRKALGFRLGDDLAELILGYAPVSAREEHDYCAATSGEWAKISCPAEYASRTGNLRLLQWWMSVQHKTSSHFDACTYDVARGGSLGLLRWCRNASHYSAASAAAGAIAGGRIEVLRWLEAIGDASLQPSNYGDLLEMAVVEGQQALATWLCSRGALWSDEMCAIAAYRGDLPMLQWLRERGASWDTDVLSGAAAGGHIAVFRWAAENGCPGHDMGSQDTSICRDLAWQADVPELFEWIEQFDFEFHWGDDLVCEEGARHGRSDVVAWIVPRMDLDHGFFEPGSDIECPHLCIELARNGYLAEFIEVHTATRFGYLHSVEDRCAEGHCGAGCCYWLLRLAVHRNALLRRAERLGLWRRERPGRKCLVGQGKVFRWARKRRLRPTAALRWVAAHRHPAAPAEWAELSRLIEAFVAAP